MNDTAPDFSMFILVIFMSIIGLGVAYVAWDTPTNEEKIAAEIENSYNIEISNPKELSNLSNNNKVTVNSLDPNDTTEYVALVDKTDDGYTLSKRNDQGEYIPLDPAHTIQDLKEN